MIEADPVGKKSLSEVNNGDKVVAYRKEGAKNTEEANHEF